MMMNRFSVIIFTAISVCCNYSYAENKQEQPHNSSEPVEITAEKFEILQNEQKAIFKGNVQARQGKIDIQSDKMIVHYATKKDMVGQTKSSVSKVETFGNVFLSTPKETAKGNSGFFDIQKNTITLLGKVMLKSGKNLVKGESLVYNLTTGESKIIGAQKTDNDSNKKTRARGLFIPGAK